MYQIFFYKDKHGKAPVLDYLKQLISRKDKDSRKARKELAEIIERGV